MGRQRPRGGNRSCTELQARWAADRWLPEAIAVPGMRSEVGFSRNNRWRCGMTAAGRHPARRLDGPGRRSAASSVGSRCRRRGQVEPGGPWPLPKTRPTMAVVPVRSLRVPCRVRHRPQRASGRAPTTPCRGRAPVRRHVRILRRRRAILIGPGFAPLPPLRTAAVAGGAHAARRAWTARHRRPRFDGLHRGGAGPHPIRRGPGRGPPTRRCLAIAGCVSYRAAVRSRCGVPPIRQEPPPLVRPARRLPRPRRRRPRPLPGVSRALAPRSRPRSRHQRSPPPCEPTRKPTVAQPTSA